MVLDLVSRAFVSAEGRYTTSPDLTESELVDLYLRGIEEELKAEGFEPGNRFSHDLLRKWAPSHALVRAWSQVPRGIAAENEITRLRSVVSQAVRFLRDAGEERKAD